MPRLSMFVQYVWETTQTAFIQCDVFLRYVIPFSKRPTCSEILGMLVAEFCAVVIAKPVKILCRNAVN